MACPTPRPSLSPAAGASAALAASVKPEPEAHRTGPAVPAPAARTPGPKPASSQPAAGSMVSPAVQMQVKLLPAVHPPSAANAGPPRPTVSAATTAAALGLPKPARSNTTTTSAAAASTATATGVVPPQPGAAGASAGASGSQAQGKQHGPGAAQGGSKAAGASEQGSGGVGGELTEEEKRNVHAIQTSPYVMQVKPRTPAAGCAASAKKETFNYEISPYKWVAVVWVALGISLGNGGRVRAGFYVSCMGSGPGKGEIVGRHRRYPSALRPVHSARPSSAYQCFCRIQFTPYRTGPPLSFSKSAAASFPLIGAICVPLFPQV